MTAAELHDAAARLVGQRVEQGLGERVDGGTLARIASLLAMTPTTTKTPSVELDVLNGENGVAATTRRL
jgi:hypothetical protein